MIRYGLLCWKQVKRTSYAERTCGVSCQVEGVGHHNNSAIIHCLVSSSLHCKICLRAVFVCKFSFLLFMAQKTHFFFLPFSDIFPYTNNIHWSSYVVCCQESLLRLSFLCRIGTSLLTPFTILCSFICEKSLVPGHLHVCAYGIHMAQSFWSVLPEYLQPT